jgi:hypothetical protein
MSLQVNSVGRSGAIMTMYKISYKDERGCDSTYYDFSRFALRISIRSLLAQGMQIVSVEVSK